MPSLVIMTTVKRNTPKNANPEGRVEMRPEPRFHVAFHVRSCFPHVDDECAHKDDRHDTKRPSHSASFTPLLSMYPRPVLAISEAAIPSTLPAPDDPGRCGGGKRG
jgi:hypothetical protein